MEREPGQAGGMVTHTRPRVVQVVGVQRRGREVSDLSIGRSGDGSMTILIGHVRCH